MKSEKVQCSGFRNTQYPARCRRKGHPNARGTLWGRFYCHDHAKWMRRRDEPVTWLKIEMRDDLGWWLNLDRNRGRPWPPDLF